MMNVFQFEDPNLLLLWATTCRAVRTTVSKGDLVVATTRPVLYEPGWLGHTAALHGAERPSSIATVLCPRVVLSDHESAEAAIHAGLSLLGRGRRKGLAYSGWRHTYFERLTGRFIDRIGRMQVMREDRLSSLASKMRTWPASSESGLYAHTALDTDSLRTRGNPCLQYIQVRTTKNNEFSLIGVYRSHDYGNKALGNLFGLSRVARFLEIYSGRQCSTISIISNNPHCGITKSKLGAYVEQVCQLGGF